VFNPPEAVGGVQVWGTARIFRALRESCLWAVVRHCFRKGNNLPQFQAMFFNVLLILAF
jgi:hypothetical protein